MNIVLRAHSDRSLKQLLCLEVKPMIGERVAVSTAWLKASLRDDTCISVAKMTYGQVIRLPGDLYSPILLYRRKVADNETFLSLSLTTTDFCKICAIEEIKYLIRNEKIGKFAYLYTPN